MSDSSAFRQKAPPPIVTGSSSGGDSRTEGNGETPKMEKLTLSGTPPPPPPGLPPTNKMKSSRQDIHQQSSIDGVEQDDALLDLEQLEELHSEAERMKALGNKHMAAQEYTRAYNAYSASLQLSPVGPSSHVFLSNRAAALLSLKRYAAAATDARRAVALAPTFGKAHARLGQALYFLKDYEGAVAAYEEAIEYEPENRVTVTYLEKAKMKLSRQKEKAARAAGGEEVTVGEEGTVTDTIVNSIATDPNASAAVVTSGFRGSSEAIMAAVGSHPTEIQTPRDPASTIVPEEEQPDEDDPDFDEAVEIQQRANKFLANKQYKRAIEEYSAALFLVPDDPHLSPELHLGRAHALNGLRRHESARNDAQLALKWQASAEAYSTMAKSLFYMKEYRGSIDAFKNCIEILPEGESLTMFDRLYLEKAQAALDEEIEKDPADTRSVSSTIPKLPPPRFVPREQAISATQNMPPAPKKWPQQSPRSPSALQCGPERVVAFVSESLGIKLNRGTDGIVRVISVAPETPGSPVARNGRIEVGDVVREAAGVDIRRPITNIMWGDTVALIKLAPRPITFVVAKELSTPPPTVLEEQEKEQLFVTHGPPAPEASFRGETKEEEEAMVMPSPANGEESVRDSIAAANGREAETITKETAPSEEGETSTLDDTVDFSIDDAEVALTAEGESKDETESASVNDSNKVEEPDRAEPETPEGIPTVSREEHSAEDDLPPQETELKDSASIHADEDRESETFELVEQPPPATKEEQILGAEIVFEQASTNAPLDGWTNTRWLSTSGVRKLRHCGTVYRHVNGRQGFFWSGEKYVSRKLALFDYPNLILVLRAPKNLAEVRQLLGIPDDVDLAADGSNTALESFLVAESVIDPKACKLRLSQLTTVTSVESTITENNSPRQRTCFELVTPTETIVLSAVCASREAKDEAFTDSVAFLETALLEVAITSALCAAHSPGDDEEVPSDASWKHQIILGTLHSFVISGNQKGLQSAIQAALVSQAQTDGSSENVSPIRTLSSRVIDAQDESGQTALHYACSRRSSSSVAALVNAGANASLPRPDKMYPCHLSALKLDEKSLSTILSAASPARPDPNALDAFGRTPMYVAVVEGRTVGGSRDPVALGHCLSALEAWGGQMLIENEAASRPLRHPVAVAACDWRSEDLAQILPHVPYRFPFHDAETASENRKGVSLDAAFHYPVHSALISLRKQIDLVRQGANNEFDSDEIIMPESKLVRTLRVLLEHGFEPNERLQNVIGVFEGAEALSAYTGYAPLQILAVSALEADDMVKNVDNETLEESSPLQRIMNVIVEASAFLVQSGARLGLDPPPTSRVTSRSSSFSEKSAREESSSEHLSGVDRSNLKLDSNKVVVKLFGGEDQLKSAKRLWGEAKSVEATGNIHIRETAKTQLPDSEAPGGSDEKSCAICWKAFGSLRNRKHRCRITRKYVCEDCSSKRIMQNGQGHRVSDGQFLVARIDAAKQEAERLEDEREKDRIRKARVEKALSARRSQLSRATEEEDRESLFSGVVDKAASLVFGEDEESTQDQVQGISESLGQTRDALNERGDKLNSLSEKTARLKDASRDFAKMAKELERSQKGFW